MDSKIAVITAPDIVFDDSKKILLIQPTDDIKKSLETSISEVDIAVSIYYYTNSDSDIKWLLTMSEIADMIIIDLDAVDPVVSQLSAFILSKPHTYYRCKHMTAPWDLLNKNRFFDFKQIRII